MLVTVVCSILAGVCFATAGLLQQHVAAGRPQDESLSPRLLLDLVRQKLWLAGIGVAVLSYAFQAVALAFGPLAVVQPLIITELIIAIPVSARLQHARLGAREWSAVAAVAVGLGVAIAAADPRGGDPLPPVTSWLLVLPVVAVIAVGVAVAGKHLNPTFRASSFAFAAAAVLGTQGALLQATTKRFSEGVGAGFGSWEPYLMAVAAIGGLLLVQSAYQAGPLAASLPVVDAVEPAVAVLIGVLIFDETIRTGPGPVTLAVAGVVVLLAGILALDTSPRVKQIYERQLAAAGERHAAASTGAARHPRGADLRSVPHGR